MADPRRVVITGLGPISAFGVGMQPLWEALCEGRTGIAPITAFDATGFRSCLAASLPADKFDPRSVVPKSYRKAAKVMSETVSAEPSERMAATTDVSLTFG